MFWLFVLAHLCADFLWQPLWLVRQKQRWSGLWLHGGLVFLGMLPIALFFFEHASLWISLALITAIHILADRWKIRVADGWFRDPLWAFLLDQAVHLVTLALVLSMFLPLNLVWSLPAGALGWSVLLAIGLIVGAVATPIGVIVGLDPSFRYAALAKQARLRSLWRGTSAFLLTLLAGPLAGPLALVGLAVWVRSPASAHPLDTPLGIWVVICVASASGALLALLR